MANWRELYETTVLETNPTQLQKLIRETEGAISKRLRELDKSSNCVGERHEIAGASAALRRVENRKARRAGYETNTYSSGQMMVIGIAIAFILGFLAVLGYALYLTGVFDR